ncbi:SLC13 family permease [Halorubellus litoreus]|uniref:SLC13 family permease n=1 Tax=Halorubellus litoreus TaxID=755308 RepID=A0ABD5VGE2_9EURY
MSFSRTRTLSLLGAVLATVVVAGLPTPAGLTLAGQYALATMTFAAVLWVTGALPLALTALLVPVSLTVLGVYPSFAQSVAGFADPVVFLLLAGFVLAEALQAHGIDRRVALVVLVRFGTSARGLVGGVMVATALLSMVVSNTATVAMMVPIVLGIVDSVTDLTSADAAADSDAAASNLQIAMLLGVAYAASLGGVGTLVGTPPNAIVVGQLDDLVGVEISFVDWLAIGLPMVAVTLPVAWALLTYVVYPPESYDVSAARETARERRSELGALSPAAKRTVAVFVATAGLWLLGGFDFAFAGVLPTEWYVTVFGGDGANALGTTGHEGVLFYVLVGVLAIPALVVTGANEFDDLLDVDWGTLLLLGGGISLANALKDTNATAWLADVTLVALGDAGIVVVLLSVVALVVLVGELASNTAMAAILAPLLVEVGPTYASALGTTNDLAAVLFAVTGAVAASYGFALPVATPPNAIVYGAGYVEREHMLRAGVLLDVVVVVLATAMALLLGYTLWPIVLA